MQLGFKHGKIKSFIRKKEAKTTQIQKKKKNNNNNLRTETAEIEDKKKPHRFK